MTHMPARLLADDGVSCRSVDGRFVSFRVRERVFGMGTAFTWDGSSDQARRLPGDCPVHALPASGLSHDGNRLATICGRGLGHSIRVWDLGAGRELPLEHAKFNLGRGAPVLRSQGVAFSSSGRYLAVALLVQIEALAVTVIPGLASDLSRSDLRVWNVDQGRELVSVPIDELVGPANYFQGVDLALSPDDSLLAVGGRRIRIYRMSDLGGG
jgi:WD40 repeat protein